MIGLVFLTLVVQVIVYVLSSILSLVFRNQLILYKFESEHQYFCIGKYLGVGAMVGNGAIVPRAWV